MKEPDKINISIDKGISLTEMGKYNEAIKCFDEALRDDPNDTVAWYNKAHTLSFLDMYSDAIVCYDKSSADKA